MGNGVKALYGFVDADNPVNVSTNATSWSVVQIEKVQNFSVTGSLYSLSGSVTYVIPPISSNMFGKGILVVDYNPLPVTVTRSSCRYVNSE